MEAAKLACQRRLIIIYKERMFIKMYSKETTQLNLENDPKNLFKPL